MSTDEKDMSLLGHIGELRGNLIRIAIAVGICAIVIAFNIQYVMDDIILAPTSNEFVSIEKINEIMRELGFENAQFKYNYEFRIQQMQPAETFNLTIKIAIIGGLILAFPYIVLEIWKFVAPGLKPHEKKHSGLYIFFTIVLFFMGALFGYYIISPIAIQFFVNYTISDVIVKDFTISSLISLINTSVLGMAFIFLLPMVSYTLTYMGVLEPTFLKKYRKQAFIIILIVAAFITPSDVISMFVAAVPLWVLYEVSILVSTYVYHRLEKSNISN